jgi:hypothetical protein
MFSTRFTYLLLISVAHLQPQADPITFAVGPGESTYANYKLLSLAEFKLYAEDILKVAQRCVTQFTPLPLLIITCEAPLLHLFPIRHMNVMGDYQF